MESAASYGHTKASVALSLVAFAAKLITAGATEEQRARNFVSQVFDTSEHNKRPYGTVMVWISTKRLPDDVRVVSISELARESNRPEFEIIQELQKAVISCLARRRSRA